MCADTLEESLGERADREFLVQEDLAAKRIEHVILLQDKLRNHIATIEIINQQLEIKANNAKTPDERIQTLKSISFNYDRLIKLYEVYQQYEALIQRYNVHVTDTINKKLQLNLNILKNKSAPTSMEFFRRLNDFLSKTDPQELDDLTQIEDLEYQL